MKKILTFVPLGVGISAAIIYIFNIVSFRVINNTVTISQILSNLKIYLYVSAAGFLFYILVKIIILLNDKNNKEEVLTVDDKVNESINTSIDSLIINENNHEIDKQPVINEAKEEINVKAYEPFETIRNNDIKEIIMNNIYCPKCGNEIYDEDIFCKNCGYNLKHNGINSVVKKIINVLEIVILVLIIYFSLNMLFDYKASHDSSFKSPFKINMTK